jgi:WD40 repeat protein
MEHYCVWRVPGFAMLGEFPHENANDILSVALSSDGRLGASGGRDAKVVIWDIEGRRALGRREAHNDVLSLAFSPNGKYLAAGTNDKGVLVFGVSGIGSAPALAAAVPVAPPPLVPSVATMLAPRRPAPQTDMFPTDASGQRLGLAVLDFDLRGRLKQSEPDAGRTISSLVLSRIDPNRFEIYERSQIMQLLQEQKLQMSDIMTDTDKAIKFGKLKGIRFIVLGSVDQLGETYFITARIVDCETGRVGVKADATTNILDHLGPSVDQLLGNMGLVGQ